MRYMHYTGSPGPSLVVYAVLNKAADSISPYEVYG